MSNDRKQAVYRGGLSRSASGTSAFAGSLLAFGARLYNLGRKLLAGDGEQPAWLRALPWSAGPKAPGLVPVCLALALSASISSVATPGYSADAAAGVAWPRGFYDYAVGAHVELTKYSETLPDLLTANARLSGYVSYRDDVGLIVTSGALLLRLRPPQPLLGTVGFSPYVSAGPSLNYLYSWADLWDFGRVSESEFSTTISIFAGAELFSRSNVSLFTEVRQTIYSDFTLDYVMVGLKVHGLPLPGID